MITITPKSISQIERSIDRIRSNRKALADDDDELDKQIEAVKRRTRVDLGEKLDAGDSGAFKATFKVTRAHPFDKYIHKCHGLSQLPKTKQKTTTKKQNID